jgi:hypothetical protein
MSLEIERELAQLREQVQENTRILKKLESQARWARAMSWIKWLVYIGVLAVVYKMTMPYLNNVMNIYTNLGEISGKADTVKNIKIPQSASELQDLLNNLK